LVASHDFVVSGRHGPISARIYRGSAEAGQASIVWFHGGGFIGGDLDMPSADWVAESVAAAGVTVVSGDYSKCLGGIHYPIPNDDVLDLWLWVVHNAEDLGIDPRSIHLGGASAGAALAATAVRRLCDDQGPIPKSVLLVYPVLHYDLPEAGECLRLLLESNADVVLTPELVRSMSENYVGDPALARNPYAFAANGPLPNHHPPTFILNAEIDALQTSGEAYGAELVRAGAESLIQCEPACPHGYLNEPFKYADSAQRSIERVVLWINAHSGDG
jgi:acetyl esterase